MEIQKLSFKENIKGKYYMLTTDEKEKLIELIHNYAFNRFQMGTIDTMDHGDSLYLKYERRMLLTEKELFDYIKHDL